MNIMAKEYTVISERHSDGRKIEFSGDLPKLIDTFSYTLECGASYSHKKGNKKINRTPKSIKGLITNLNNAKNNAAANGCASEFYYLKED